MQKLLCRWWYAMDWPAKQDVIPAPPSYLALEGYPGVYVCVEVSNARIQRKLLALMLKGCAPSSAAKVPPRYLPPCELLG